MNITMRVENAIHAILKVPDMVEATLVAWAKDPVPITLNAGLDSHEDAADNCFPDPYWLAHDYLTHVVARYDCDIDEFMAANPDQEGRVYHSTEEALEDIREAGGNSGKA